jgi:hypothetical protein
MVSLSWLTKKRKPELIDLAEQAGLDLYVFTCEFHCDKCLLTLFQ